MGLALLLSPDPGDIMGFSLSTGCGWGTLICTPWVDLGVLNSCCLVFPAGGVCCMLGGLLATLGLAVDWGLGGLAAILSTSVICGGLLLCMVGAVRLTGRGTSLICILFCLLYFHQIWMGVSATDRTSPEIDHFLVWGSCNLTGCMSRSCGGSLACVSYLL